MMTSKQGENDGFGELPAFLCCLLGGSAVRPGSSLSAFQNDIPLLFCKLSFKLLSIFLIISGNIFSLVPVWIIHIAKYLANIDT